MCNDAQVDWDDLRFVLAIARDGTLSRAAERLNATHTTVGRRLRAIERRLNVRLFDQTPDGFTVTAAGRDVVGAAERVERELLAVEARVLGKDAQLEGKLRVTTLDILLRRYTSAFVSFCERFPDVELTVTTTDSEVSLQRREADVALRLTNTPPGYAIGRRAGEAAFALYASRALVARVGEGAPLSAFPWIHWDEQLNPTWLDQWIAEHAPGATIAMRINTSMNALHELVAAGVGVHFLACFEGDADPTLVRLQAADPRFTRGIWLLFLDDLRSTGRVRAFVDHMEAHIRALDGKRP